MAGRRTGSRGSPTSLTARALDVVVAAAGAAVTTAQIADALGVPAQDFAARHRLGATLATRWRTAACGTTWRTVHRTAEGSWVHLPDQPERPKDGAGRERPAVFTEVAQDGDARVLADGDGRLWVATPLRP